MLYLILASILWSLSFGLIKTVLGDLDPFLISFLRLLICFLFFLPLMKNQKTPLILSLLSIGAVQFGLMYSFYIWSFQYLAAHEVALLTATTPLFVILIGSFREKFWSGMFFLGALFAVIGAAVIAIRPGEISVTMTGVALVQAANLCFAIGQLFYKKIKLTENFLDHTVFGWAFLGACIVPLFITYARGWQTIVWPHDTTQWMTILYLGIVPSGLGFFLWNKGVSEVNIGQASVMNNLKIPLAVGFSWLLFGENVSWLRLLTGALLIVFGLWLVKLEKKKQLSIFV